MKISKQNFSQRSISTMYNVKNFLAKIINVHIGKGTLIYLFVNILTIFITISLNNINMSKKMALANDIIMITSSFALAFFIIGRIYYQCVKNVLMKKDRNKAFFVLVMAFAVVILVILQLLQIVYFVMTKNELALKALEIIWLSIVVPIFIAILVYQYTKYKERNANQILFIKNFRIKKLEYTDKNAIVIQNFNTISICDAYIYQKVDGKNKFVCCKCFEPNQAIECEFDENAKEITILLSDDSGDFKVGRKNTFKLDFLEKFDYNNGRVNELEHEELMNYPLFGRRISAKAIIFDIKSTLINQKFAYEAQWANTIAELQSMQIEAGENIRNPIKNLTVTDIKDSLTKNGNMESDEQISAMMDELGIDKLGEYNYKKEKAYRGINSFLNELYKDNKIIICAIAYGDKSGIEKFEKSYLASLFRGRIFKAETSKEAMEIALKSIAVNPEECVMVGDSIINDIVPAKNLGMQTIRVKQGLNEGVASTESVADKEIDNIKKVRFEINF